MSATYAGLNTTPTDSKAQPLWDIVALKRMRDESFQSLEENRLDGEKSRDYYDGEKGQISHVMREALRLRGQPEIWINRVRAAVDGVVGVIGSNKVDPRAYPREPGDDNASDVASDTLRYTAQQAHFDAIKVNCLEDGLIEGCYAAIVEGGPDQDVTITKIAWDEFFYDVRSKLDNFHDARYLGIAKWMYGDQLFQLYAPELAKLGIKNADELPWESGMGYGSASEGLTWQDKPENVAGWIDPQRKRLLVSEVYHQSNGTWLRSVFCAAGILEHGESPYHDDKNRPRCAIVAGSCYVSRENWRYGIVRDMRPIQDEINMRRSKALHQMNVRTVQISDIGMAAQVSIDTVRTEAAKADGVLPAGYQIVDKQDIVEGQIQLMQEAKAEMQLLGPNLALQGRDPATDSGRQDQIRQAAGLTQLQRVLGRFADWEERVYKAIWAVQRQFWTAPKWIRVTGDDMSPKYIQINNVVAPGQPQLDPQTGQPVTDPNGNPVWAVPPKVENHIAEMDVDIIIDTVPDTASLQQEMFQEFTRLAASSPQLAQQITPKLLIQMSSLPRKQELLKALDAEQQANAAKMQDQQNVQAQALMTKRALDESVVFKNTAAGKAALIDAIAAAVTAHMQIDQAQLAEQQLVAGIPGADGVAPVAPVQPIPPAPQPVAQQ